METVLKCGFKWDKPCAKECKYYETCTRNPHRKDEKMEVKNMKKYLTLFLVLLVIMLGGCSATTTAVAYNTTSDVTNTERVASNLAASQPTPTDINYSLERYNLIRRAYWVNGQREKANMLICEIEKPLGHIVLFTESGGVVGKFIVDGKVSSLNSYLTPDSEYYELVYGGEFTKENKWIADIDGSYGENDNGIFFFTPDGKYIEWTGIYLYTDIPIEVDAPIVRVGE